MTLYGGVHSQSITVPSLIDVGALLLPDNPRKRFVPILSLLWIFQYLGFFLDEEGSCFLVFSGREEQGKYFSDYSCFWSVVKIVSFSIFLFLGSCAKGSFTGL